MTDRDNERVAGMSTTRTHAARIGTAATLDIEGGKFQMTVRVLDHKSAYGDDRWLVRPVTGRGDAWVSGARLTWPLDGAVAEEEDAGEFDCQHCGLKGGH
jgi:hypothetical protein